MEEQVRLSENKIEDKVKEVLSLQAKIEEQTKQMNEKDQEIALFEHRIEEMEESMR